MALGIGFQQDLLNLFITLMANPTLVLWCDGVTNRLMSGWQSNQIAQIPKLKQGDSVSTEIHWIASYGITNVEEVGFPPAASLTLAIGLVDEQPTSGTFTITYDGDTTTALAYNATASVIETALNNLASITADGGVSVDKNGNINRISWNDFGVRTEAITINTDLLSPSSQSTVTVYRNGDATHAHIVFASISQAPVAVCTTFTPAPEPIITAESVLDNTWRISIYPFPKNGSFQLTYTAGFNTYTVASLPYNTDLNAMALALNATLSTSSAQFVVNSVGQYSWDIVCPPVIITNDDIETSVGAFSSVSALSGFSSMIGTLDLNTANLEEFLSGTNSRDAIIEVQVDVGGNVQTIAHSDVNLINDLISASMFNIIERTDVMPVDSVVRYDTSQSLTGPQKLTARTNIDAASLADVVALGVDVGVLSGQLSAVEYSIITVLQAEALNGAELPSSTNVFITESALTTALDAGLATKAALVHTHVATDITDSTSAGRNLLIAADLNAQKTILGITGAPYAPINSPTFTGIVTIPAGASIAGYLNQTTADSLYFRRANNLSDLVNPPTARTNLGVGAANTPVFNGITLGTHASIYPQGITFHDASFQNTAYSPSYIEAAYNRLKSQSDLMKGVWVQTDDDDGGVIASTIKHNFVSVSITPPVSPPTPPGRRMISLQSEIVGVDYLAVSTSTGTSLNAGWDSTIEFTFWLNPLDYDFGVTSPADEDFVVIGLTSSDGSWQTVGSPMFLLFDLGQDKTYFCYQASADAVTRYELPDLAPSYFKLYTSQWPDLGTFPVYFANKSVRMTITNGNGTKPKLSYTWFGLRVVPDVSPDPIPSSRAGEEIELAIASDYLDFSHPVVVRLHAEFNSTHGATQTVSASLARMTHAYATGVLPF